MSVGFKGSDRPFLDLGLRKRRYKIVCDGVKYHIRLWHKKCYYGEGIWSGGWSISFLQNRRISVRLGGPLLPGGSAWLYRIKVDGQWWEYLLVRCGQQGDMEWQLQGSSHLPEELPAEVVERVRTVLGRLVQPLVQLKQEEALIAQRKRAKQEAKTRQRQAIEKAHYETVLEQIR